MTLMTTRASPGRLSRGLCQAVKAHGFLRRTESSLAASTNSDTVTTAASTHVNAAFLPAHDRLTLAMKPNRTGCSVLSSTPRMASSWGFDHNIMKQSRGIHTTTGPTRGFQYVHPVSKIALMYLQSRHLDFLTENGLDRDLRFHRDGTIELRFPSFEYDDARLWTSIHRKDGTIHNMKAASGSWGSFELKHTLFDDSSVSGTEINVIQVCSSIDSLIADIRHVEEMRLPKDYLV